MLEKGFLVVLFDIKACQKQFHSPFDWHPPLEPSVFFFPTESGVINSCFGFELIFHISFSQETSWLVKYFIMLMERFTVNRIIRFVTLIHVSLPELTHYTLTSV